MGAQPSIPGMEEQFAKDYAAETEKEIRPMVTFENFPGIPNGQVLYNKYDNTTETLFYEGSHKIPGLNSLQPELGTAEMHMLIRSHNKFENWLGTTHLATWPAPQIQNFWRVIGVSGVCALGLASVWRAWHYSVKRRRRTWFEEEERIRAAESQTRIKAMKSWLEEQKTAKASAGATLGGAAADEE